MKVLRLLLIIILFTSGCTKANQAQELNKNIEATQNIESNKNKEEENKETQTIKEKMKIVKPVAFDKEYFEKAVFGDETYLVNREDEVVRQLIYTPGEYFSEPLMIMSTDGSSNSVLINDYVYDFKKYKDYIYYLVMSSEYDNGYYKKNIETGQIEPFNQSIDQKPKSNYEYFEIADSKIGIYKMNIKTKEITKILDQDDYDFKTKDFSENFLTHHYGYNNKKSLFLEVNDECILEIRFKG